jgi:hypothetical protein
MREPDGHKLNAASDLRDEDGYPALEGLEAIVRERWVIANDEVLDELALHLAWASRVDPRSPSRKHLHKMLDRPEVLDLLAVLVDRAR